MQFPTGPPAEFFDKTIIDDGAMVGSSRLRTTIKTSE
jgi:hypothetical protein